ncbi:MAG: class I SAM-dependent methyltransferase family protein [Methanotrichaceae archaeon]|nr:class I SAM-dependent methyltransferase family protein [Methanotrichaceae archaeon]
MKTVLNKTSKINGEMKVASYEIIAGNETVTTHKEFGFVYKLDVNKVFFNSSLGYERMRLASITKPGEMILIPFSCVGPFVILLAAKGAKVLAVEKNLEACRWLVENIRLNKVEDNVTLVRGEAFRLHNTLNMAFDRAIIPTPYGCDQILDIVYELMKFSAPVHFYTFKKHSQIEELLKKFERKGFFVQFYRKCGNVAPCVKRWAFDLIKCNKPLRT